MLSGCHHTYGGNGNGACCQFPFVYNDMIYHHCIRGDQAKPWCGTTYNFDRDGKWGYCKVKGEVSIGNVYLNYQGFSSVSVLVRQIRLPLNRNNLKPLRLDSVSIWPSVSLCWPLCQPQYTPDGTVSLVQDLKHIHWLYIFVRNGLHRGNYFRGCSCANGYKGYLTFSFWGLRSELLDSTKSKFSLQFESLRFRQIHFFVFCLLTLQCMSVKTACTLFIHSCQAKANGKYQLSRQCTVSG